MNESILVISPTGLALAFIPAALVILICYRWGSAAGTALYATVRMLVQLLLIGYVLIYIFESDQWWHIVAVLVLMLAASSWIALHPLGPRTAQSYLYALIAISLGGVPTLALVTQAVIDVSPWFSPRYVVPLAGMIFSTSMTAVSLAGERFQAERSNGADYIAARRTAFQAALIPTVNSLFAVGLVALPGMMTGQILSGVSPLIAAQYQIVVMTMLLGATGLTAAIYLTLMKP
ncbi:MAG: ABC transporter permease [Pseudomonadota bacterium]